MFLICGCSFCERCLVSYFEDNLGEKTLRQLTCPRCDNPIEDEETYEKHLGWLTAQLAPLLNANSRAILERRLAERLSVLVEQESLVTCQICAEDKPMNEIYAMYFCDCKICQSCAETQFTLLIDEKAVEEWTCVFCKLPDYSDQEQLEEHVWYLMESLRTVLKQETYQKAQLKLAEWTMRKDERFRWCRCGNGFIWQGNDRNICMECPNCLHKKCFKCDKDWQDQHNGISCEQFEQWTIANDPIYQEQGLKRLLEQEGITCPNPACKFKYEIARGGCLHFKCSRCPWEFCGCCGAQYLRDDKCKREAACAKRGLHAHCEPNCFYFLRDYPVNKLQDLLQKNEVRYGLEDKEPGKANGAELAICQVLELKDNGDAGDTACGLPLCPLAGGAKLCEKHYKEYLVTLIRKNHVDIADLTAT